MKDQEIIDMVFNEGSKEMIESIKTKIMSMIVKYGKNADIVAEEIVKALPLKEIKSAIVKTISGEVNKTELKKELNHLVAKELKTMGLSGISSSTKILELVYKKVNLRMI